MEAKVSSSVVVFLTMMLMMSSSYAYDFYVGGRDGWVTNPSEGFNHWAERNRFQVNDRLVFKYKKGEDSVLVVNEEDYRACNTSNIVRKLDDGDSRDPGRCQAGQRLVVVVLALRRRSGPSPAAVPPQMAPSAAEKASPEMASSPGPAASGSAFVGDSWRRLGASLVLCVGVLIL
ncbi:unnamed protein product [Spirodela intermedia]|uniref:Phytocyanin domain-containing protein n=1 Tax=Spirodela intermedia TaxID=51605 RepID=A0A7I8JTB3_SPIIN|nr:unnamed protein product [Spirodela intermedia]CAA6673001.1 unnamed protein product [Spirodela intermedia]